MTNINEMVERELDFKFMAAIYNNFNIALRGFELFKKKNEDFFRFDGIAGLHSSLLTFAIKKQIYNSAYTPTSLYRARLEEVNKFKYSVLMLEKDDFIINIHKTDMPNILPSASKYRSRLALGNRDFDNQLCLKFEDDVMTISEAKKYAIITYKYLDGELKHLSIIIPDYQYKSIQLVKNILEHVSFYEGYKQNDYVEEQVIRIREDIQNEFEEQLVKLK